MARYFPLYSQCDGLASYGDLVTPEGYEKVYNVSGWSENVLEFIEHAEQPLQVIDEIEAFEPV